MANPNPNAARLAKARKRIASIKAVDIDLASSALAGIILECYARLDESTDTNELSKLGTLVVSACREYRVMVETGELESRLSELEKAHGTTRALRYNKKTMSRNKKRRVAKIPNPNESGKKRNGS